MSTTNKSKVNALSVQMLTTDQVANMLNVTRYTVYALIRDGKLPAFKITDKIFRYKAEDVQKLIETSEAVPAKVA